MNGVRLYAAENAIPADLTMKPGEYVWLPRMKMWQLCAPNGDLCVVSLRTGHTWTEHEDRTLTISPSIQFNAGARWHGYLERGVWRTA
jgi:hypothetical protein